MFRTTVTTVPARIPYLHADPQLVELWRKELEGSDASRCLRVGIAWQGTPAFRYDRQRSIPLANFEGLSRVDGIKLISLQKGPGTEQLRSLQNPFPVLDFSNRLDETAGPFMDTAAIIKNLDLVISSDTAIPHLAGALGVPVWVALPLVPDWRWLLQREDSPWYPTMRLFRQTTYGQWDDVFERIIVELKKMLHGRK